MGEVFEALPVRFHESGRETGLETMPRVKRGAKRAHKRKKVLKLSSGFYGTKSNAYRMAMQAVDRAGKFATRDRQYGLSYNHFISGLKAAGCDLDRKVLAQLAASEDPKAFAGLVDLAKQALAQAPQAAPAPAKA